MRAEIKRLHDRLGATSLYVTHDQVEAMTLADRIVVMRGGLVQQVGTPEEIYDRPATTFVAAFIGAPAMNLLPGRIEDGRRRAAGRHVAARWAGVAPDGHCDHRDPARTPDLASTWKPRACGDRGPAAVVEPLGSETLVTLDIAGSELHARVPARSVRQAGEPVRLALEAEDIHLFSPDGARL